jgi:hypothetical protein
MVNDEQERVFRSCSTVHRASDKKDQFTKEETEEKHTRQQKSVLSKDRELLFSL